MNIDKFKHQHTEILESIDTLRQLSRAGVTENAADIARAIVAMSSTIKLHLSAEYRVLYPSLQRSGDEQLTKMSQHYQDEMQTIAADYDAFSRRWNTASQLIGHDRDFRADANHVLRKVYERMQRENHDFYPRIETA
ncbi:hemerythrin domain-containing protein [Pectobacterium aroidearum]|uniref:hemerythrin domain-containing protein n=1 Tax=Pectobacterium aroidearum TaxID=1201031 RepID=UPI0015F77DE2|nr:hemerythrin domain-containing protein [Pectobacterium aroidearum]MBA5600485.1 hemerythrin domain-containing protein [Pectobacterium aroidearum]